VTLFVWISPISVDQSHHRPSPKSSLDPGMALRPSPFRSPSFRAACCATYHWRSQAPNLPNKGLRASRKIAAVVSNLCNLGWGKCGSGVKLPGFAWVALVYCCWHPGILLSTWMPGWCDTSGALENGLQVIFAGHFDKVRASFALACLWAFLPAPPMLPCTVRLVNISIPWIWSWRS